MNSTLDACFKTLKRKEAQAFFNIGTSAFYDHQRTGILPPPVKLCGTNASAWLFTELQAAKAAMIAGYSKESIQALIKALVDKRSELAPKTTGGRT